MSFWLGRCIVAALAALLLGDGLSAQEVGRPDRSPQVSPQPGAYKGSLLYPETRKRWFDAGIDFHLIYVTESASAVSHATGTRYTGQIEFGGSLDLDKLGLVEGGKINAVVVNREGKDLSTDKIGNLFRVQEVYGANKDLRLVYLTYEQSLAGGAVDLLAGRTSIGQDFAYSKLFCNFQNNGLCGRPRSLPANGGFSNFPLSAWGGRARLKPLGGDSYVQVGVFEVNPRLADRNGFQFGFKGDTGVVVPVELGYVRGSEAEGTLGTYKVGAYYDTSNTDDVLRDAAGAPFIVTGLAPRRHSGRATVYAMADQAVARFGNDATRPITVLIGATYAPTDRSIFHSLYYAAAVAKGPIAARPGDTLGLLVLSGRISPDITEEQELKTGFVQRRETIVETNYNIMVSSWLQVAPGFQYIIDPNADARRRDVSVIALKTQLNF